MKNRRSGQLLRRVLAMCLVFVLVLGNLAPARAAQTAQMHVTQAEAEPLTGPDTGRRMEEKETAALQSDGQTLRVSIVLEERSTIAAGFPTKNIASNTAAMAYRHGLAREQETMTTRIGRKLGHALDVVWNLTLAANIISANVSREDIAKIEAMDGVLRVVPEMRYEAASAMAADPATAVSTGMTGAVEAWNSGYTGAGSRIAIIDTGLDTTHQSFNSDAFLHALEETAAKAGKDIADYDLLDTQEIAGLLEELNVSATARELTVSEKIPFGYNYVDGNTNIGHLNDTTSEHGSHVAGIAAANRYIPDGDGFVPALDTVLAAGSAPDAQVLVMKVFGESGGAWDSDYMAAIEDAIVLGCDAVNLSLGTASAGMTSAGVYEQIMELLETTDTVVVTSAGNNGYWSSQSGSPYPYAEDVGFMTVGAPGSYTNGLSVASVENKGIVTELFEIGGEGFPFTETLYRNEPLRSLAKDGDVTLEYVFVDGVGQRSDYEGIDLTGKVVFCSRGQTSFSEKANLAASKGAAAVIIYNSVDGSFGMDLSDYTHTIPVAALLKADADAIRERSTAATTAAGLGYYTGTMTILESLAVKEDGSGFDTMSGFSSWGVPGDLSIKPEITAPGGNVYSVAGTHLTDSGLQGGSDQYEWMSGTSMAAPQVTGMMAQLMHYIGEQELSREGLTDRALAQSLLMSTARPLYAKYDDSATAGYRVSVLQQGAGLANVADAMGAKTYVLMDDAATGSAADGKVKAELGDDPDKTGVYRFTFTLNNLTDVPQSYTLSSEVFSQDQFRSYPEYVKPDGTLGSSFNSTIFMDTATSELEAQAVFTVDGAALAAEAPAGYDFDGDGDTDKADAQRLMDHAVQGTDLAACQELSDVDGDGDTDVHDAQVLLARISDALVTVPAGGSVEIEAVITLTELDKHVLDTFFENGTYIEGFVYADAVADAEGVVSSGHSIPMLAFYGGWTDASMFDKGSEEAYYYGLETIEPYTYSYNGTNTNSFSYVYWGDSNRYFFGGNPYLEEAEYLEERNALNGQIGYIHRINYALIRNAAAIRATVTDVQTGDIYFQRDYGEDYAAYYNANTGYWENYQNYVILNWAGTDENGEALPDGTTVRIALTAAPEYYVRADGSVDWAALGEGATYSTLVTIDTEAPIAVGAEEKIELASGSELTLTVRDDRYVAAAMLYNSAGDLIDAVAPGEQEVGVATEVTLGKNLPNGVYTLEVADYAENTSVYRIFLGTTQTSGVESVTVNPDRLSLMAGQSRTLTATVAPDTISDRSVTWTSSDESVATVTDDGTVTALSAGEAVITAASVLDPNFTGRCIVTVTDAHATLNAVVWDQEGIWFSEFDTRDLSDITHLTESTEHQINAVAMAPDGSLYASTMYIGANYGEIYRVDPDTFGMTLITDSSRWGGWPTYFTDIAYAPGLYGTGGLICIYGSWVCAVDLSTGACTWIDTFEENLVGIATVSGSYDADSAMGMDFFYLIGTTGTVYQEGYIWMDGVGVLPYTTMMGMDRAYFETGMDTGGAWYYNSAYYDGSYLYWSNLNFPYSTTNGIVNLYAIDADFTETVYDLGEFAPGTLPVAGLYQNGGVHYSSALAQEKLAEVQRAMAPDGSLNSVEQVPEMEESADGRMILEITARDESGEVAATDGLITVTYDPAVMTLANIRVNGELKSIVSEDGSVTFGYANADALTAGANAAELVFDMADPAAFRAEVTHLQVNNRHLEGVSETVAHSFDAVVTEPTCTEGGFTTYTCAHCGWSYVADHTEPVEHDWSDWSVTRQPTYLIEGEEARSCARCGEIQTRPLATLGNPFEDVPQGSWYYDSVLWALEEGITTGTTSTAFSPDSQCQRAQVVTFLWRAAGEPEPSSSTNPFADVKETDFFYKAVLWAVEEGITNGTDAEHFSPYGVCNRAQVVTFLWRAMGKPAPSSGENPFTDVESGSFYETAVLWAVEKNITNGLDAVTFGPNAVCNRAQIVTFLYRTFA